MEKYFFLYVLIKNVVLGYSNIDYISVALTQVRKKKIKLKGMVNHFQI